MSASNAVATGSQRRFVRVAATITATGGLLFGYDTGTISGAILFINEELWLTPFLEGLVMSSILLAAVEAGSAGLLSDRLGRRILIVVAAVTFSVGPSARRWRRTSPCWSDS